jgi:Zn-dependent protease
LLETIYIIPVLLFSIVVHEIAHGWTALKCGDPTAQLAGRLTLNPVPHLDLFGSIILPALIIFSHSSFFIAWAKPVPVNPANFRNYRRDDILVSIAGPISNLLTGLFFTILVIVLQLLVPEFEDNGFWYFILKMCFAGISLNVILAIFNLIPIPPLDGSHILASLLPPEAAERFRSVGFFGIFILLFILQVPVIRVIFHDIVSFFLIPYQYILNLFL